MQNDDAQYDIKTGHAIQCNNLSQNIFRRYLIIFAVLLSAIIILCINNIAVYKSYSQLRSNLEEAFRKMNNYQSGRNDLLVSNEKLVKANDDLKEKNNEIYAQNEQILTQIQVIKKINEQLVMKNKELQEDNIELQNSLKKAASVGIKPQNYTSFDGVSRSAVNRRIYIGRFLGTAYTPCKEECGNNKGITNSGEPIIPGLSIAIDSDYWPFGTVFYIKGLGYAVAMDTGSAIKGKYRFDFAVFDKKFAQTLGQNYWEVYLIKLGNGRVEDLNF